MLDFAEKEQIVAVDEKSSIAETNLAAANTALGNLASERIKNEQLWRQVDQTDAVNLPQFLSNAVIDGLRAKRNELVTQYQEKLETFKPGYPAMVQINNKIAEIDKQLAAEIKTIRGSLKGAYEASLNQEKELKTRVDKLRADVLDFQKRSIQYNILKREVDTNRQLYNGLLQRFKEVDVAGGAGTNNVFIVDKADLPGAPSSPQLLRSMLLSLMLGLGGGLGLAYLLENLDDVIDTIEEAERVAGLATLGVIPIVKEEGGANWPSPMPARRCPRLTDRSAHPCNLRQLGVCRKHFSSPAPAPGKANQSPRWLWPSTSHGWGSRCSLSMRICAIRRCIKNCEETTPLASPHISPAHAVHLMRCKRPNFPTLPSCHRGPCRPTPRTSWAVRV